MHTIDATNKIVGRLATEIALILRGKTAVSFKRNVAPNIKVIVSNASKMKMDDKRLNKIKFVRYSGYPGGLKKTTAASAGAREILRRAVSGMLPKNKNRDRLMKNLTIKE